MHVLKLDQTKLSECTIECDHIGFVEEKGVYLLYNHEHQQVFDSHNMEFNEEEGLERVTIDSEDDDDGDGDGGGESGVLGDKFGDPEGGQRVMDHQEIQRTSGNYDRVIPGSLLVLPVSTDSNASTPPRLHRSTGTTRD